MSVDLSHARIPLDRIVAVYADLGPNTEQIGTGYLISATRVLTAWHCTIDKLTGQPPLALRVVRQFDGAEASATRSAFSADLDLAVLSIDPQADWKGALAPVRWGRVDRRHSGTLTHCAAVGFPMWQLDPARHYRDTGTVDGSIRLSDGIGSGLLTIRDPDASGVTMPPGVQQSADSPWGGLSGSVVFHGDLAIGVVVEHRPWLGDGALQIRPIGSLVTPSEHGQSAEMRELITQLELPPFDRLPWIVDQVPAERLRNKYLDPETARTPLRLMRAEYQLVPFQSRDELTVLLDWCEHIADGSLVGLAVITGVGGSGKTRLALELAERLRRQHWQTGVLTSGQQDITWLAEVHAPLLVVVDYADGRIDDVKRLFQVLGRRDGPPAVVVATARSAEGQWLSDIIRALDERDPYRLEVIQLDDAHPRPRDIFTRTVQKLRMRERTPANIGNVQMPAPNIRWTTLDLILLGWITARDGNRPLPETSEQLYAQVLSHEQDYWRSIYRAATNRAPSATVLERAAACVSLLSPTSENAYEVLAAVTELKDNHVERLAVRDTLVSCLQPGPAEGLSLRPDPVGDHLVLSTFGIDQAYFARALDLASDADVLNAVDCLTRAGQNNLVTATALVTILLANNPARWPAVLEVAKAKGGPALDALTNAIEETSIQLPLDDLSAAIPLSNLEMFGLAYLTDNARLVIARRTAVHPEDLVELLVLVSARADRAGDRASALKSITEAVTIYRDLAAANPVAFLPDLASSLNNLSIQQSGTGDRAGALSSITESVSIRRDLAAANPAAFLPDVASSLNNLSIQQSGTGDRAGALSSITESVSIRRDLAAANPAAFLPDLASSLNNLSNQQSDTGDRAGALTSITESVTIRRDLAAANPAAFLPEVASSLNNLSNQQSDTGDRAGALSSITEAVTIRREVAAANPAAFLPDLAMSLNNLSVRQSDTGDRAGALSSITEAVTIYRDLAAANPAAFLPDLAMSLNNLSVRQSDTGDRAGALSSITEAVTMYRELAAANPAAFLPDLAKSLNNLSVQLPGLTDGDESIMHDWLSAIKAMPEPIAAATLRVAYVHFLNNQSAFLQASLQLLLAAEEAEEADKTPGDASRATTVMMMEARQEIRALASSMDNLPRGLPEWATQSVPDEHLDLVTKVANANSWSDIQNVLENHREMVESDHLRVSVRTLAALYLGNPGIKRVNDILDELATNGFEATLIEKTALHERLTLLRTWISTETWAESKQFLAENYTELSTPETVTVLSSASDEVSRFHLAILSLCAELSFNQIYEIIEYPHRARDPIIDAIETAALWRLPALAMLLESTFGTESVHYLMMCVLAVDRNDIDRGQVMAEMLVRQTKPVERRAYAINLRKLKSQRPELAGLTEIIEILERDGHE